MKYLWKQAKSRLPYFDILLRSCPLIWQRNATMYLIKLKCVNTYKHNYNNVWNLLLIDVSLWFKRYYYFVSHRVPVRLVFHQRFKADNISVGLWPRIFSMHFGTLFETNFIVMILITIIIFMNILVELSEKEN